jgi:Anti-repressor SinI
MTAGLPEIQASILGGEKLNMEIVKRVTNDEELDNEWVQLILEALEVGISVEEIKEFFSQKRPSTVK